MSITRAYAITSQAIERERERVGGDLSKIELSHILQLCDLELPPRGPQEPIGPYDVKLNILAVSAEHNVAHAALADIVDIVKAHGGRLIPGNSAIAEVLEVGSCVYRFKSGDIVQTHCNGSPDRYGYPERIWGFDVLGSVGWYAEHAVVKEWQILELPLDCGLSLWEMAALPLRAPTAYHLWRRAIGIYRVKVSRASRASVNVLSFGGGVGELFLMLARSEGHNAYFCSGNNARRDALARQGIVGIDQGEYHRFAAPADIEAFRDRCCALTHGRNMDIVCDMLRGPLFEAGLSVAARQGVNVSAGWQLSQRLTYNSALLSVKQISLDHTHYETIAGCRAATELYGRVFRPKIHDVIYDFEHLPQALQAMHRNELAGIPIIQVAQQLPESVRHIAWPPTEPSPADDPSGALR